MNVHRLCTHHIATVDMYIYVRCTHYVYQYVATIYITVFDWSLLFENLTIIYVIGILPLWTYI